jgi:hypothetical protein
MQVLLPVIVRDTPAHTKKLRPGINEQSTVVSLEITVVLEGITKVHCAFTAKTERSNEINRLWINFML